MTLTAQIVVLYKNGSEVSHSFNDRDKAMLFAAAARVRDDVQQVKVIDYDAR